MVTDTDADHRHYDSHDSGTGWATPKKYWSPLADALGGFDLDPASGAESEPIADERYTVEDNGLETEWFGDVWVNPPYSRSENPVWAKRIHEQAESDAVDTVTALVPASTDTDYFQDHYASADLLTFIDGRIKFHGDGNNSATFPSVIATYGDVPQQYIDILHGYGFVAHR